MKTSWYKSKTAELKNLLHDSKYEFDLDYRRHCDLMERIIKDCDRSLWFGLSIGNNLKEYNGFLPLLND